MFSKAIWNFSIFLLKCQTAFMAFFLGPTFALYIIYISSPLLISSHNFFTVYFITSFVTNIVLFCVILFCYCYIGIVLNAHFRQYYLYYYSEQTYLHLLFTPVLLYFIEGSIMYHMYILFLAGYYYSINVTFSLSIFSRLLLQYKCYIQLVYF